MTRKLSRQVVVAACLMTVLSLGSGRPVLAEAPADTGAARVRAGFQLSPTATCPEEGVAELNHAIEFIRGQTWTHRPGSIALNVSPDLERCRVVLNVGELTDAEEAALQAGAGSRLAIEYRRDWARPSRLLLVLWVVFGGSGLVWMYRRYAR